MTLGKGSTVAAGSGVGALPVWKPTPANKSCFSESASEEQTRCAVCTFIFSGEDGDSDASVPLPATLDCKPALVTAQAPPSRGSPRSWAPGWVSVWSPQVCIGVSPPWCSFPTLEVRLQNPSVPSKYSSICWVRVFQAGMWMRTRLLPSSL